MKNKIQIIFIIAIIIAGIMFEVKSNIYIVTTDLKWTTAMFDGGYHTNEYYYINFNTGNIKKYQDKYTDVNSNYIYKDKQLYSKKMTKNYQKNLKKTFKKILKNSEVSDNVYGVGYYIIESNYKKEITTNNIELIELLNVSDNS